MEQHGSMAALPALSSMRDCKARQRSRTCMHSARVQYLSVTAMGTVWHIPESILRGLGLHMFHRYQCLSNAWQRCCQPLCHAEELAALTEQRSFVRSAVVAA